MWLLARFKYSPNAGMDKQTQDSPNAGMNKQTQDARNFEVLVHLGIIKPYMGIPTNSKNREELKDVTIMFSPSRKYSFILAHVPGHLVIHLIVRLEDWSVFTTSMGAIANTIELEKGTPLDGPSEFEYLQLQDGKTILRALEEKVVTKTQAFGTQIAQSYMNQFKTENKFPVVPIGHFSKVSFRDLKTGGITTNTINMRETEKCSPVTTTQTKSIDVVNTTVPVERKSTRSLPYILPTPMVPAKPRTPAPETQKPIQKPVPKPVVIEDGDGLELFEFLTQEVGFGVEESKSMTGRMMQQGLKLDFLEEVEPIQMNAILGLTIGSQIRIKRALKRVYCGPPGKKMKIIDVE